MATEQSNGPYLNQLRQHLASCLQIGSSNRCMIHVQVVEAQNLLSADPNGFSDPYIKFKVDGATEKKEKTPILSNTLNPVYDSTFTFVLKDSKLRGHVLVEALDHDKTNSNDSLGFATIPLNDFGFLGVVSGWFSLFAKKHTSDSKRRPGRFFVRMMLDKDRSDLMKKNQAEFTLVRSSLLEMVRKAEIERERELSSILDSSMSTNPSSDSVVLPDSIWKSTSPSFISSSFHHAALPPLPLTTVSTATPTIPVESVSVEGIGHKLTVACASWNVGNAPPSDTLTLNSWLQATTDIIVVGTQENQYQPRKGHKTHILDWESTLTAAVGGEYELLCSESMGQIHVHLYSKKALRPLIDVLQPLKATEATGIANVGTNKGGAAVAIDVFGTTMCFVSSHLAAHTPHTARRNQDMGEILAGVRFKGVGDMSITSAFKHVFWVGDLNYRLEILGTDKEPDLTKWDELQELISTQQYDKMMETDQLRAAIANNQVYVGFNDCPISFPPTFKVSRDIVQPEYTKKRTPSYCDRVLWKSQEGFENTVVCKSFDSCNQVVSSDHKPVIAMFDLTLPTMQCGVNPYLTNVTVLLGGIQCSNLPVGDVNGFSDPFVRFMCNNQENNTFVQTSVKTKNLNPTWSKEELPMLKLNLTSEARLSQLVIPFNVLDKDLATETVLCSGVLSFKKLNIMQMLYSAQNKLTNNSVESPFVPVDIALFGKTGLPAGTMTIIIGLQYVGFKDDALLSYQQLAQRTDYN